MFKRWSWLAIASFIIVSAFGATASAEEKPAAEQSAEPALDLSLRSKAAAMPMTTADGSTMTSPASHG